MGKRNLFRAALVSLAAVSCMAAAVPADALTRIHVHNPTFNMPGVEQTGDSYRLVGVGGDIPGWSVTHGNVDVYGRGFARTPQHTQALDLNGTVPGTVSQTLETTPGSRVVIRWKDSPDTWTGCTAGADQSYSVRTNGQRPELFDPGRPSTESNWQNKSIDFIARDDLTTLEFASKNNSGACGPMITAVVAHENSRPGQPG